MSLPELIKRRAERLLDGYCAAPRPHQQLDVRLHSRFEEDGVTIWLDPALCGASETCQPLAQLRYHEVLGQWTLHYRDEEGRWKLYLNCAPSLDLEKLLGQLDSDPLRLFWP